MGIPCWAVREVHPQKDYTMIISFADGSKKVYNARPLLEKKIYTVYVNSHTNRPLS